MSVMSRPRRRSAPSFRVLAPVALGLALAFPAGGQTPPTRTHQIVPEDYFTLSYVSGCAMSPSGDRTLYTELRWDEENDARNTDIWTVDTATGDVLRLTFDLAADTSPQWSADGRWIYFKSARKRGDADKPPFNGKGQVWRVDSAGGDVQAVTQEGSGVGSFRLSADGHMLYYTTSQEQTEADGWESFRKEFDQLNYGHGVVKFSRLYALDLRTWRSTKLVDENRVISAFAVSDDQRRVAMVTQPDNTLLAGEGWSTVDIYDTHTGELTQLDDRQWREEAPSPYGWIVSPGFSSDGDVLSFRVDFDGYPGEVFFAHFDAGDDPVIRRLARPREVTVESPMRWIPGTRTFCFAADDHARRRVEAVEGVRHRGEPRPVTLTPGDMAVHDFGFSRSGRRMVVLMSGEDHPGDLFVVHKRGPRAVYQRLTKLNPQVDTWKIPRREIVRWTSPDGTPVEGVLELPPGYDAQRDGRLPLLVTIHGGPTASSKLAFRFWIYGRTLYAAQGWAVFDPNYRGSTGYGDEFLTDLIGNKNNLDVADILSGVDMLVERGIVDEERMAVTGWSNGGYLTNCIITRDQRFKAASSGAGVFDTAMQWSIEDTPGHVINYSRGLPWERPDKMRDTSPLYDADKIRTPTLIHVGEFDERVPQEHARSLYRALKHYLHVPTELIIYPGEGHGLTKYSHRKAKLKWDMEWFNRHVLSQPAPDSE